jgi:hypothetical protein
MTMNANNEAYPQQIDDRVFVDLHGKHVEQVPKLKKGFREQARENPLEKKKEKKQQQEEADKLQKEEEIKQKEKVSYYKSLFCTTSSPIAWSKGQT